MLRQYTKYRTKVIIKNINEAVTGVSSIGDSLSSAGAYAQKNKNNYLTSISYIQGVIITYQRIASASISKTTSKT